MERGKGRGIARVFQADREADKAVWRSEYGTSEEKKVVTDG